MLGGSESRLKSKHFSFLIPYIHFVRSILGSVVVVHMHPSLRSPFLGLGQAQDRMMPEHA